MDKEKEQQFIKVMRTLLSIKGEISDEALIRHAKLINQILNT